MDENMNIIEKAESMELGSEVRSDDEGEILSIASKLFQSLYFHMINSLIEVTAVYFFAIYVPLSLKKI